MEIWKGLAQRTAMQSHMVGLQECTWEVQHCPEDLDSGQQKTTGVKSHCCFVKSHRGQKSKKMNISSESHINNCVWGGLFLKVLRLGASFIPNDRVKSQHDYISATGIIRVMCH